MDCSYSRHHADIDHSKDVGVHCRKGKIVTSLLILCNSLGRRHTLYNKFTQSNVNYTVSCEDGDLRLFGGESESKGLLQVCFSQRWGTINEDGWTLSDTSVACKQLGFEGALKL